MYPIIYVNLSSLYRKQGKIKLAENAQSRANQLWSTLKDEYKGSTIFAYKEEHQKKMGTIDFLGRRMGKKLWF